jgi:hypothetical protein
MDPSTHTPADRVVDALERGVPAEATDALETARAAPAEERKETLRALRTLAEDRPATVAAVGSSLVPFLRDEERSVRLTTAKLFVALAEATPESVVPVVPSLADRLADPDEFYYVRARSAEALGYVALERPTAVDDPEILADLRVGLSFDEPEVTEKLAKALECVALGDPARLRHQVSSLAAHLDDEDALVRYHLVTALVAIGCERPARLADATDALRERLRDESPYVRGRAAEGLAVLARADATAVPTVDLDGVESAGDDPPSFLTDRVRLARHVLQGEDPLGDVPEGVGTLDSVRSGTASVVEEMTSPDGDGTCPHCGLALPAEGPPFCPRCGAPP